MAHLHFSQQADGEHVQSRQQQHGREHHQRPVLGHDVCVVHDLVENQPTGDSAPSQNAEHSQRAEEVQRARKIFKQEAYGDEVEKDAEGARDSVMRCAAFPVDVLDGNFDDRRAVPRGQRRNEAVQLSIELNLPQDFPPVSLKSRAKVMDIDAAQIGHQTVGATRRETAQPEIVDAILAPSADDVVALCNFFEEQRNIGGIVLQVAVHGNDVFPAGMVESSGEAGGLAKIPPQLDDGHAAVNGGNLTQQIERAVDRTIIDQHHLESLAARLHHRLQTGVQVGDVLLFVVERNYD